MPYEHEMRKVIIKSYTLSNSELKNIRVTLIV